MKEKRTNKLRVLVRRAEDRGSSAGKLRVKRAGYAGQAAERSAQFGSLTRNLLFFTVVPYSFVN